MKVAIVANPFAAVPPTGYGGIELVIDNLIKGLIELGHEPILLGTGDSKVKCELLPIVDKAMAFPHDKKQLRSFRSNVKAVEKKTTKMLKEILPDIDVIHSHGYDLRPFLDFPHVFTIHNEIAFNPAGGIKNRLTQEFPFKPDTRRFFARRRKMNYVSISKNQQAPFPTLNYLGVVYNGEDPDQFPIVTDPKDYVCFLGRFEYEKGAHLALELALSIGIKIKLAGKLDFHGQQYFNDLIKPHLKNPNVEYLGELGFKDKVQLLKNAKCNLHPTSFREPFGLTVLEAAYCGTPTLAIARGSMPELIKDGHTGALVEDFLEAPVRLKETFEMDREYIASRSRRKFNYLRMSKGYVRAYRKAVNLAE